MIRADVEHAFRHFEKARFEDMGAQEIRVAESVSRRRVRVASRRVTIRSLIELVEGTSPRAAVFMVGGVPRDILGGFEPRDVDCVYVGTDMAAIESALYAKFGGKLTFSMRRTASGLLGMGTGDDSIEIKALRLHECSLDCTANTLLMHAPTETLIDPFGTGIADARARFWRIPCSNRSAWASAVRFPIWRMLKMCARGFTASLEEKAFVYKDFVQREAEHDPAMWTTGPANALQEGTFEILSIIFEDVTELQNGGYADFGPEKVVLMLVKHGVLLPIEAQARDIPIRRRKSP